MQKYAPNIFDYLLAIKLVTTTFLFFSISGQFTTTDDYPKTSHGQVMKVILLHVYKDSVVD